MKKYKYILEPYNGSRSRFRCPRCESKENTYTRFIDSDTNEYLPIEYGRCDRLNNCNYFLSPYNNNYQTDEYDLTKKYDTIKIQHVISYIKKDELISSISNYENNNFTSFLITKFGINTTNQLIKSYLIGTSSYWKGSTIFWQIDINRKIRTGKIMLYDEVSGKRVKKPKSYITWYHSVNSINNYSLSQCLFGEHLLNIFPNKPVAIVESEKTAIISSIYFPQFVWLATGSVSNLNIKICEVLRNRNVYLFPDLNSYLKWNEISKDLNFKTFEYLEQNCGLEDKNKGLDLADFLIK